MLCGRRPLQGRALSHSLDAEEINGGDPHSGEAAVYAASRHRVAGRLDEKSAALTSSIYVDYQPELSEQPTRSHPDAKKGKLLSCRSLPLRLNGIYPPGL
jgi:hypothetical protein